MLDLAKLQE